MAQLYANNAASTLAANLPNGTTSAVLSSGGGSNFPSPSGGDFFLLTIFEKDVGGDEINYEIVKCTARVADTLTIERNAEAIAGVPGGGNAYDLAGGANTVYVELRTTAAGMAEMLQANENLSDLDSASTARTNLGLGAAATLAVGTTAGTVAAGDHTHTGVYQPYDAALTAWAGITPATNVAGFLAAPSSANLRSAMTDETGTGALYFAGGDAGTPSALVGTNISGTGASFTAGQATAALGLKSATTTVSVSSATAPSTGQVLTATGSSAATWQAPAGGIPSLSVVTGTSQTAAANTHYVLTNVAATTVTLPASPTAGDTVIITVANGLTTNVINPNGSDINGVSGNMTIDGTYASVWVRYIDATRKWRLM